MKQYPSIKTKWEPGLVYWVFDKLDGSNIRAEWSAKSGFYKFGSRKILLSETHPNFGKAIGLIRQQEGALAEQLAKLKVDKAVLYFEFFGSKSFAGFHEDLDNHRCVLIDVDLGGKGQMDPEDFIQAFTGSVELPRLLYQGELYEGFVEAIRSGKQQGMTFEGVVCKSKKPSKWLPPHMCKIKNEAWIKAVIAKHGANSHSLL